MRRINAGNWWKDVDPYHSVSASASYKKEEKDALIVNLSDMHSGSNFALFPNRLWTGKNGNNHTPTSKQMLIYKQWEKFKQAVQTERIGKRLVVVHNGDAIEGVHHNNVDVCTRDVGDQVEIHLELMDEFKKAVNWQAGDKLYYVRGTATHTGDTETGIAEMAGAQQLPDGDYAADHLSLNVNGRELWWVHEGAKAGKGPNEGNGLRNWLRDVYYDSLKSRETPPDVIYSGHVHQPTYNCFVGNDGMNFRVLHGIILPSWQSKTRFAYKVAAVAKNIIGGATQLITAGGDVRPPRFYVLETESVTRA